MEPSQERIQALLMGLIDGELSPEEANEINNLMRKNLALREEYESLLETHGQLSGLSFEEPEDVVLKKLWKSPYSSFAHSAALWMILGGYAVLTLFGLWAFFFSGSEGWQVKVPIAAIIIGVFVLLFQKIRERIATHKVDPYKEVKR